MQVPVEIVYQGLGSAPGLEARIRKEAAKLERYHDRIISCRVVIEESHHRHHKGNLFTVRIHIRLPGQGEVAVSRVADEKHAREDPYVAVRDAFDAARRQLQDQARTLRRAVKSHEAPPHGRVTKIFSAEGYGFIETPDGREIYFHRNSVVDGEFDKLLPGAEVRFAAEMGEKGEQASTVRVIGKHHLG